MIDKGDITFSFLTPEEGWRRLSLEEKRRFKAIFEGSKTFKARAIETTYLGYLPASSLSNEGSPKYIECLTSGSGYSKLFINLTEIAKCFKRGVNANLIQALYIAKFSPEHWRPKDLTFKFKIPKSTAKRISPMIGELAGFKGLKDLPLPQVEGWEGMKATDLAASFCLSLPTTTKPTLHQMSTSLLLSIPLSEIGRAVQLTGPRVRKFLLDAGLEQPPEIFCYTGSFVRLCLRSQEMRVIKQDELKSQTSLGYIYLPLRASIWLHPFPPSLSKLVEKATDSVVKQGGIEEQAKGQDGNFASFKKESEDLYLEMASMFKAFFHELE